MRAIALVLAIALPGTAHAGFDHGIWNALLQRHVVLIDGGKASQVDYAGFAGDRELLRGYLDALSRVPRAAFASWPKPEQLAFLINAYNAFTVELVLTKYPDLRSIKDLGSLWRSPWQRKFFVLLDEERTLDDVEHGLIRADGVYDEPRIHFAVVCASIGCPALRNEAYADDRLQAQLEDSTRKFLSDRSRNRFDPATGTLRVSKLFDWYEEDFSRGWQGYRSVAQFLADYPEALADDAEARRLIAAQKARIRHLDYDWTLNDVNHAAKSTRSARDRDADAGG